MTSPLVVVNKTDEFKFDLTIREDLPCDAYTGRTGTDDQRPRTTQSLTHAPPSETKEHERKAHPADEHQSYETVDDRDRSRESLDGRLDDAEAVNEGVRQDAGTCDGDN